MLVAVSARTWTLPTSFRLQRYCDVSVEVHVEDAVVYARTTSGAVTESFDTTSNSVEFDPAAAPAWGSVVTVSCALLCQ